MACPECDRLRREYDQALNCYAELLVEQQGRSADEIAEHEKQINAAKQAFDRAALNISDHEDQAHDAATENTPARS